MKVILDTNVVISAILRGRVPGEVLLFVVGRPDVDWVVTQEILDEYREVLSRPKFALPVETLREWVETIEGAVSIFECDLEIEFPRDQKDAKFLACAMISNADFLVTGDRDFEEAQRFGHTKILSATQFKTLVCDQIE